MNAPGMHAGTSWVTGLAVRVVLVLGLAYVSLWWSYQHFYSVFGVSPDDVGLAPSTGGAGDVVIAVLRLGLWLSIALLGLGLLPVVCIGFALYAFERSQEDGRHPPPDSTPSTVASDRVPVGPTGRELQATSAVSPSSAGSRSGRLAQLQSKKSWGGGGLVALASLVGIFFANAFFVDRIYAAVVVALVVLVTLVFWLAAARSPLKQTTDASGPARFAARWWGARQPWLLRASDLFLVLAAIGVLFVDLPGDAHKVGTRLLDRAGTGAACKVPAIGAPIGRFRLDLLSVHGFPARFAAVTLPPGLPSRRPFEGIYLGSANGWLVIYEKTRNKAGRILRIPTSSGVSILTDAGLDNCPGVH